MQRDAVDRIVEQWARERPDVDVSPMRLVGRLHRLADLLDGRLRPVFADAGLGEGEFDILATLRRAGPPFSLSPGQLAAQTMVTSGAVSKRVDRLVARGMVSRHPRASDGRGRLIALTERGLQVVDAALEQHVANEAALIGAFTPQQRADLERLLRRWLLSVEGPRGD